MPTYQYSCTECGHFFEQFQSFSEDSLTVCPQCEGRLRKVFNAVGVVFKGSGFYRTDSRAESRSTSGSDGGSGSSGAADKADKAGKASKATGSGEKSAPAPSSGDGSGGGGGGASGTAKTSSGSSTSAA